MSAEPAIPHDIHTGLRSAVQDGLGAFWSSLFRDQPFLDALLAARSLSASQLQIDAQEALLLRDHRNLPVFHREHWHPLFIRRSGRNLGRGLSVGMDSAVIGPQTETAVYLDGEVFVVGGNAEYSKVNTYPFAAMNGCPLKRVLTCICDSICAPTHVLVQGRDFDLAGNVLVVRKEQDPFESGGYRTVEDGTRHYRDDDGNDREDSIAVLWVCDGEYDTNNVADFLAYPMGFDVESSETSKRLLSAYWDAVVHGITPRYLNTMLGALYGVPTAIEDEIVEAVTEDSDLLSHVGGDVTAPTDGGVYACFYDAAKRLVAVRTADTAGPVDGDESQPRGARYMRLVVAGSGASAVLTFKSGRQSACGAYEDGALREDGTVDPDAASCVTWFVPLVERKVLVTTDKRVYRVGEHVRSAIKVGSALKAGDFLTDEITVYHSFSEDEFAGFVASHAIDHITLPAGSIAGVDTTVTIESRVSEVKENDGWWFELSGVDSKASPFWSSVFERTTEDERKAAISRIATGDTIKTVDPLKTVGYVALANTVIVYTKRQLIDTGYARTLFTALQRLMPGYASLLTVDEVTGS